MTKAATPPDPAALAAKIWQLKAQAKRIYARCDKLQAELMARAELGQVLDLGNGVGVALVDNYADSNVAWGHSGVRRIELKQVTR